jgi:catechol 2,3-dioxygenase
MFGVNGVHQPGTLSFWLVQFYHGVLGFDITASFQGAAFLSAGGYHHHLDLNSWNSRGAPLAPPDAAGLETFSIRVPSADEQ